jgi:hypothetical protein
MEPWPQPFILMVDRGDCTFVRKVRHAQTAGASAVIIADNTCLCSDLDCKSDDCENLQPILADDGSGSDVLIPSILMRKQDADRVKEEVRKDDLVRVSILWETISPSDRVNYELWTTPTDEAISQDFWGQFQNVVVALGSDGRFTPQMFIYDGVQAGCADGQCYNLCTNSGRYCATDPDNNLDEGITGAQVVVESLRRECIWKVYGADGMGLPWWDYVASFTSECGSPHSFSDEDCVLGAMSEAEVDPNMISRCIGESGGAEGDVVNDILEGQLNEQRQSGITLLPTLIINGVKAKGAVTVAEVFSAICSAFTSGSEPSICLKCAGPDYQYECSTSDDSGNFSPSQSPSVLNQVQTEFPAKDDYEELPVGKKGKKRREKKSRSEKQKKRRQK